MSELEFKSLYSHETNVYSLPDFKAATVDQEYLKALGVDIEIAPETLEGLRKLILNLRICFDTWRSIPRKRKRSVY